jgi:hypothetical protein
MITFAFFQYGLLLALLAAPEGGGIAMVVISCWLARAEAQRTLAYVRAPNSRAAQTF